MIRRPPTAVRTVVRFAAVVLCSGSVIFLIMVWLPGDAATVAVHTPDPERIAELRAQMGIDQPTLHRLLSWWRGLLHGEGGTLHGSERSVWSAIEIPVRNSAILVAFAWPLLVILGCTLGIAAGTAAGSARDTGLSTGAQATLAVPEFATTTLLLVIFSGILHLVPAVSLVPPGGTPLDRPDGLFVPALGIAVTGGAWLQRMVRAAVADAHVLPHVAAARLSGMHPLAVLVRHTLPAASAPVAQACAATVPYAVTGTVVVENVVGFPGIGTLVANLIANRETEATATVTVLLAVITMAAFLVADRKITDVGAP